MPGRREELVEATYRYALAHGLTGISLRPVAEAIGSSTGVLRFLFGSKDDLVRAVLARARADELALLDDLPTGDLIGVATAVWHWLADPAHAGLLRLWAESYAAALTEPNGPWSGFARRTVTDWLAVLAAAQPAAERRTAAGRAQRTAVLAVLRGSMLDLLATGDHTRVTRAVEMSLAAVAQPGQSASAGRSGKRRGATSTATTPRTAQPARTR